MRRSRPRLLDRLSLLKESPAEFERAAQLPEGFITRAERGLANGKFNKDAWTRFEAELEFREILRG